MNSVGSFASIHSKVDQDMGSVKWLGSVLSTSLIGSNYFTTMIVVSLQSAPEPTQKTSLTRLGGENHEEPPPDFCVRPAISCHREERAWPDRHDVKVSAQAEAIVGLAGSHRGAQSPNGEC